MKNNMEQLVRLVRCPICKQRMFNADDPRYEPELTLNVFSRGGHLQEIYIHEACWNRTWLPILEDDKSNTDIPSKYNELIFAVGNAFPNETLHETALRYILEAERKSVCGCDKV